MNRVNSEVCSDLERMGLALKLAQKALSLGEVPVGCVIVKENQIVATGFNKREFKKNPLYHAELVAIDRAAKKLGTWRLEGCVLYVSLEPCVMCAGALVQSRISRLVYGATDPKGGGVHSLYQITQDPRLNHRLEVTGGVMQTECSELLKGFFKELRQRK